MSSTIPFNLLTRLLKSPLHEKCERWKEGDCAGRLTFEHVWIYAGKQINEFWAIIRLCWHHHLEANDKQFNEWVSINRASEEDLAKYPNRDWQQRKKYLNQKYDKKT